MAIKGFRRPSRGSNPSISQANASRGPSGIDIASQVFQIGGQLAQFAKAGKDQKFQSSINVTRSILDREKQKVSFLIKNNAADEMDFDRLDRIQDIESVLDNGESRGSFSEEERALLDQGLIGVTNDEPMSSFEAVQEGEARSNVEGIANEEAKAARATARKRPQQRRDKQATQAFGFLDKNEPASLGVAADIERAQFGEPTTRDVEHAGIRAMLSGINTPQADTSPLEVISHARKDPKKVKALKKKAPQSSKSLDPEEELELLGFKDKIPQLKKEGRNLKIAARKAREARKESTSIVNAAIKQVSNEYAENLKDPSDKENKKQFKLDVRARIEFIKEQKEESNSLLEDLGV